MWDVKPAQAAALEQQQRDQEHELAQLEQMGPGDLWLHDIKEFEHEAHRVESGHDPARMRPVLPEEVESGSTDRKRKRNCSSATTEDVGSRVLGDAKARW